jgi:hypothetical protein
MTLKSGDEASRIPPPRQRRMSVGFLLGTMVAAAAGWAFAAAMVANYNPDQSYLELTPFVIAAGCLAATILTIQRSTRRLGKGMLIGLTVMLPVAGVLAILWFGSKL